jgi:proteic killer suppression protein
MIRTFKDRRTQRVYDGEPVRELQAVYRQAERRLLVLDAAETLESLMMLPSNRFKALGGDRGGQYSIRINDQWRICFEWHEDGAHQVQIVDYH